MSDTGAAPSTMELLARLARDHDADAWALLMERYATDIYRQACKIIGDGALAEDAVHETMLQLRKNAPKFAAQRFDPERAARHWIMRIASNVSLQILRERKRMKIIENNAIHATQEHAAVDPEHLEILRREIADLPEDTRLPLAMHYFGGIEYEELAAELDCPAATLRSRVHRGMQKLRERLAAAGMALAFVNFEDALRKMGEDSLQPATLSKAFPERRQRQTDARVSNTGWFAAAALFFSVVLIAAALFATSGAKNPTATHDTAVIGEPLPLLGAEQTHSPVKGTTPEPETELPVVLRKPADGGPTAITEDVLNEISELLNPKKAVPVAIRQRALQTLQAITGANIGNDYIAWKRQVRTPRAIIRPENNPAGVLDGLKQIAAGTLPPSDFELTLMVPEEQALLAGRIQTETSIELQLHGREVCVQMPEVETMREMGDGVAVPEFDLTEHKAVIGTAEFQEIIAVLIENDAPHLTDTEAGIDLSLTIGDSRYDLGKNFSHPVRANTIKISDRLKNIIDVLVPLQQCAIQKKE